MIRHWNYRAAPALVVMLALAGTAQSLMGGSGGSAEQDTLQPILANLPFEMAKVQTPSFPNRSVNIVDYGAVGDGHTLNTGAFARAIAACAQPGGGTVLVPSGIWLSGPIQLKSNINLHLERGAVILFSPRLEDYPLVQATYEGIQGVRRMSPIYGIGLQNIAITGEGIVDGSGQAWRPVKKSKMTDSQWKGLIASGGAVSRETNTWWPSVEAMNGADFIQRLLKAGTPAKVEEFAGAGEYLRPVMVSLVGCQRVLLDGPTFQNSPAWNIHPLMCEDLVIRNLTVLNPWYSQNGDGLDLESCRRAVVYNCRFDVGDDAICIKSGKDEAGRRRGKPCEEIVIADCVVYHGHGGFTIGSEMSGGVRNLSVRRCTFLGTDVGLRFKTNRGRGGVVEKIYISDIQMKDIPTDAIGFNMYYGGDAPIPEADVKTATREERTFEVNEGTPRFQDIILKNIVCTGAQRAVQLEGLPEMPIRGIELDNVLISAQTGLQAVDAEQIKLSRVRILPRTGPVFSLKNSREITLREAGAPAAGILLMKLEGEKTRVIRLADMKPAAAEGKIERGKGVPADAVIFP